MPNQTAVKEWLTRAYHDLSSAQVLYDANHYTDTIGFALQQAIEKTLKSFLAYENKQIQRTHNLVDVYGLVDNYIQLDESQIKVLGIATTYCIEDRYPPVELDLPPREEIKEVLDFAADLFARVCQILEVDKQEITD